MARSAAALGSPHAAAFGSPRRGPATVVRPTRHLEIVPDVPTPAPSRFAHRHELDGIRACAVLAVMYFHATPWIPKPFRFYGGFMGVDVFFVLSGYLITTLLLREFQHSGRINLGGFYLRRALRLLPALTLAVLLASLVARFMGHNLGPRSILQSSIIAFTFLGNWFQSVKNLGLLGHTWSLAVEEQFYLLWPFVLFLLLRKRCSRTAIAGVLAFLAAASVATRFLIFFAGNAPLATFSSISRTDGILLGSAVALAVANHRGIVFRLLKGSAVGMVGALALLTFTAGCGRGISGTWCGAPGASISATILIGHLAASPNSVLAAWLSLRPLRAIGRMSYGMYLYHWPIVVLLMSWKPFNAGHAVILFAATLALATGSYVLVERRFIRMYGRPRTRRDRPVIAIRLKRAPFAAA